MDPDRSRSTYEVKASMLRGQLATLERMGLRSEVAARASPATRELMAYPPASSAWVDGARLGEIERLVGEINGVQSLRRFGRESTMVGILPMVRSALEGIIRLFGASPGSILSRAQKFAALGVRGIAYDYTPTSDRSGVFELRYPQAEGIDAATFRVFAGTIEAVVGLTGVAATVSEPELVADPRANAARYVVTW